MSTRTAANTGRRLSRGGLVGFLIVAAVLLSGCPAQNPADCDCPNMEAVVSSIDWVGDGTAPYRTDSEATGPPDYPLSVTVYFEGADGVELQRQVEDRLKSFPSLLTIEEDDEVSARFVADSWLVTVFLYNRADDREGIAVAVKMKDDDARAAEILAPIVDALGVVHGD